MTANQLIRKLQGEVAKLPTGEVPVKFDGRSFTDADVEVDEAPDGYSINIKPIYF